MHRPGSGAPDDSARRCADDDDCGGAASDTDDGEAWTHVAPRGHATGPGPSPAPGTGTRRPSSTSKAPRSWPGASSFASVGSRKRRHWPSADGRRTPFKAAAPHHPSPATPAPGAWAQPDVGGGERGACRRDTLRYLSVSAAGGGSEAWEVLDIADEPASVSDDEGQSVSEVVRDGLFPITQVEYFPGDVPMFDYEGAATYRVSDFAWSGPLYAFSDSLVPYELARGQIIPYYRDPVSGCLAYYAGIDTRFNEVGGFGGAITGRRLRDGYAGGTKGGETTVDGAFREFSEESLGIFGRSFAPESLRHCPSFVVDETLVILLRVVVPPGDVNTLFAQARRSLRSGHRSGAFRENRGISVAGSAEMHEALRSRALGGLPLWEKYWRILDRLNRVYRFDF